MFAIAFDLDAIETTKAHPKGLTVAYSDIRRVLAAYGFEWRQGSVYTCDLEDIANLIDATETLRALPWFPESVRDIRAFKVEQWSDLTPRMKR